MNSEQEGLRSKLLLATGSSSTPLLSVSQVSFSCPIESKGISNTSTDKNAVIANMGDVLTKENGNNKDDSPSDDVEGNDIHNEREVQTIIDDIASSQDLSKPPLTPSPPLSTNLTTEQLSSVETCSGLEITPLVKEETEIKKNQLVEEEKVYNKETLKDCENNSSLQNTHLSSVPSTTTDDLCNCDDCKWKKRDLTTEDLQEMMKLRRLGIELRQYIRYTFNWFMETSGFSTNSSSVPLPHQPHDLDCIENFVELRESVVLLCERVPYHLFMWLVGQAQEFVIGVKVQLLTLLYDHSIENLAEVFLTKLLDGYEALLATAVYVSDLLEPLQKELFSKVNLTWGYINKSLYQNYVYSDPLIQNNLPPFIGQLRKHVPLKGSEYYYLVHRYIAFDDEITKIGSLSPEIERLIDKYNAEQVVGSVMKTVREDFKRFKTRLKLEQPITNTDLTNKVELIKEIDDSTTNNEVVNRNSQSCSLPNAVEIQSMFNDWKKSPQQRLSELVEALTLTSTMEEENKSKAIKERKCYPSCLEKMDKDDINKSVSSVSCETQTYKNHLNSSLNDSTLSIKEEKCMNLQNNAIVNHTPGCQVEGAVAVVKNQVNNSPAPFDCSLSKQSIESSKETIKTVSKTVMAQTAQTQTRHSTTQTSNAAHNQGHVHRHHHPGRCSSHSHLHGSLSNAVIKSSGPHRTHVGHNNHPSGAVTCHKQQHIVEHIKRLSTNDLSPGENGDCSDSASSHEESCSATNSPSPRDSNRHCDCCYCEVFGHGVPSVAPVSRNYNEMRERLRQILSKKKSKVCKVACKPLHFKNSIEISLSSSSLSSSSSTSSTITNVDSMTLPNSTSRPNTPSMKNINKTIANTVKPVCSTTPATVPAPVQPKEDHWNIEAAVEFIEGNKTAKKDKKKAEKKARQKQKKLEEKLKKEKEEEEHLKLIELQKKTPEVTITVVNPQKLNSSQRTMSQKKLPDVSILPASAPKPSFSFSKQENTQKKKNNEVIVNNNFKNANKMRFTSSMADSASMESAKKKTANIDKNSESINVYQAKSKTSTNEVNSQIPLSDNSSNLANLTKKERKKLRRKMEKQEALKEELNSKQQSSPENQLQIVTIKRVMESNNAEPTVTITLKGQTPAEDRVLFTLVNGQTKNSTEEKQPQTTGKKKKNKGSNNNNQQQKSQIITKTQQIQNTNNSNNKNNNNNNNNTNVKLEQSKKGDIKNIKQQQQPTNKDKSKCVKQEELKPLPQQSTSSVDTKVTKSKKDKKKNNENKENIMKQVNNNSQKEESHSSNKMPTKATVTVNTSQKQQQLQQLQHQQNSNSKNIKANKNSNQTQAQGKNNTNQTNSTKSEKSNRATNIINQTSVVQKNDGQKNSKTVQNMSNKQKQYIEPAESLKKEQYDSAINSHYKETNNISSSINIENLKLPPGITITKVDVPVKPLPLKTNTMSKPINNSPKQTTIIAAPMSGIQPVNYGNTQGTGNVIVVDTGRLKQDLMPKNIEKETSKDLNIQSSTSKKKKKKKNKNTAMTTNNEKVNSNANLLQSNKQQQIPNDYMTVEPARILHNPTTNMVTIRNPAFDPSPPKMEPTTQQAAIIKVAENGMVTIRSPALQQAINAGLQPPPKPDFIVKGNITRNDSTKSSNNGFINGGELSSTIKGSNGMPLSTDIADLRRRLDRQSEYNRSTTSSTLFSSGLSSIQISKVTNGQAPIPENGINLKGTSITLTKIRSTEIQHNNQHQYIEESNTNGNVLIGNASTSSKSRKKKKRGNGVRQCGDDWNLVESVFTPKDIDLEDGEMDDAERELEAFKRFCLQSVPPPRKEKVNLNLKDIVLKKKSSSSTSSTAAAATAAATAAAVVAAI